MRAPELPRRFRPSATLRIPLQTGDGFAMSLFLWSAFWMLALAACVAGLVLLAFGHWIVGPLLALVGAFFVGAFWSFPRDVWVARPCDLELTPDGFRVLGGFRAGAGMRWDQLDAAASGLRLGKALLAMELVAVTRSGELVPLAEGEEHESFVAALDAFRASEGLEPVPPRFSSGHDQAVRLRGDSSRSVQQEQPSRDRGQPVVVEIIRCKRCGAAACPIDAPHTICRYCDHPVPMLRSVRRRLREASSRAALQERNRRALQRLLKQPSAPITLALMDALAVFMVACWLLCAAVVGRAVNRSMLDFELALSAIAAPLLLAVVLSIMASVVSSRRAAVRAVAVDFAAIAPAEAGKPHGCRVCGAPLPELDQPVVRCAYCESSNVLSCARPRAPAGVKDRAHEVEETLAHQQSEQIVRFIFLVVVGAPALYGAAVALARLAVW
jgi:hypothetical protein